MGQTMGFDRWPVLGRVWDVLSPKWGVAIKMETIVLPESASLQWKSTTEDERLSRASNTSDSG